MADGVSCPISNEILDTLAYDIAVQSFISQMTFHELNMMSSYIDADYNIYYQHSLVLG